MKRLVICIAATLVVAAFGGSTEAATRTLSKGKGILALMRSEGCHKSQLLSVLAMSGISGSLKHIHKGRTVVLPENCAQPVKGVEKLTSLVLRNDFAPQGALLSFRTAELSAALEAAQADLKRSEAREQLLRAALAKSERVAAKATRARVREAKLRGVYRRLAAQLTALRSERGREETVLEAGLLQGRTLYGFGMLIVLALSLFGTRVWTRRTHSVIPREARVYKWGRVFIFPHVSSRVETNGNLIHYHRCAVEGCHEERLLALNVERHLERAHKEFAIREWQVGLAPA